MPERIMGIDPGSRKVGWGILEQQEKSRKWCVIAQGVLRLNVEADLSVRMKELATRLKLLCERYRPDRCGLEDVFISEGPRSALILGQARGAVLATLGLCDVPVYSYSATQVKLAVCGSGRAQKAQVGQMVRILLQLEEAPAEDAADALAIALCMATRSSLEGAKLPQPKKRVSLESIARAQGKIA